MTIKGQKKIQSKMSKRYKETFYLKDMQMENKYMRGCSKCPMLLNFMEMQIKTTMRHLYTPKRMDKIKNGENIKFW
jgi:hypothetical protein